MFRIRHSGVTGKDMLRLEGDFRRMTKAGAEEVATQLTNNLLMNLQAYNLIWRGYLEDSIRIDRVANNQLSVSMDFWGYFFERDREIPPGVKLSLLTAWARTRGLSDPVGFINAVWKKGHIVRAKPFISDSLNAIRPQIRPIMERNLKTTKVI